ncbi:TIGR01777 family oxidoreductase [bacterium]|nr:TIGR01777 family oxidoreductase [bacterium]MBU1993790.1 TIGR01777 family oxidoreductase [bacterium]
MKIALTGASGFVGKKLQQTFENIIVIQRSDSEEEILKKLNGVEIVINLAGAPILKKWSDRYKEILISSRVHSTNKLVRAINRSDVEHFISTSAIGAYADNKPCDESCTEVADDFLGFLTGKWEEEALKCEKPTAILRFGVILGKDGGALMQMLFVFRLGLGGVVGDGKMMTSWIDIADLMNIYKYIIEQKLTGIFNAVSPAPVSNHTFTKALGSVLKRPTILPVPEFALRLIFGEGASVLTASKEIYPKALQDAGFVYEYTEIKKSLENILK